VTRNKIVKRFLLSALLCGLAFSACDRIGVQREKAFDFIESLELADRAEANGCLLQSKDFDSPFVSRSGWRNTWSTNRRSLVSFPLLEVERCELNLSLYPVVFPGLPAQGLKLLLNGQVIGEYEFPYEQFRPERHKGFFGLARLEIPLDEKWLLRGSNVLELNWRYIYNPADVVSQNTIHIPSGAALPLLAVLPRKGERLFAPASADRQIRAETIRDRQQLVEAIHQPVPSDFHYYLRIPANSVLHYAFRSDAEPSGSAQGSLRVAIDLEKDAGAPASIAAHSLQPAEAAGKSIRGKINLKKWANNEIVKLSFSAREEGAEWADTGQSLYWTELWLASPPSATDRGDRTPPPTKPDRPPNVVIFLIDTLRRDFVGAFNSQQVWTPAFDQLAQDSVTFTNAYSVTSWTLPTVASLLTGQDPYVHEAILQAEQMVAESRKIPDELVTLHEALKALDYATVFYTANGMIRADLGFDRGVDDYDSRSPDRPLIPAAKFADWLQGYSEQRPFFAYLHNLDPHSPYDKRESFFEGPEELETTATLDGKQEILDQLRFGQLPFTSNDAEYIQALYLSEVKLSDFRLGQVIQALKDKGLYESSLIVALADHGEEFLDHDSWQHGDSLYQEQIHIPLVIKFPGNRFAGTHYRGEAGVLDIYPTVLDVIGAAPVQPMPGRSLLPLLSAEGQPPVREERYSSLRFNNRDWSSVVEGRWKLILRGSAILGLYDLENDPGETRSLALEHPVLAGYYRQRILDWQRAQVRLRKHLVSGVAETVPLSAAEREQLRAMGYLND